MATIATATRGRISGAGAEAGAGAVAEDAGAVGGKSAREEGPFFRKRGTGVRNMRGLGGPTDCSGGADRKYELSLAFFCMNSIFFVKYLHHS